MNLLLCALGAMALLAGFIWLGAIRDRSKISATFAGRAALTDEQFFAHFNSTEVSLSTVSGVRRVLGEQLGVDMSRLAPTSGAG